MSGTSDNLQRKQLRQTLKSRRDALSSDQRAQAESDIVSHLLALTQWPQTHHIASYRAQAGEVGTQMIEDAVFATDKQLYLPVINNPSNNSDSNEAAMDYFAHTAGQTLVANCYGILEPIPSPTCQPVSVSQLDWVLVPILGADAQGYRLGHGAGYFDRYFAHLNARPRPGRPLLIGLAFSCQQIDSISPQAWDVPLNALVTETGATWFDT
ncbi:MAG: 5-formyltetrahydrofolate cyclo-ligase [Gammaproteobacteria bacterium]|nr:5-formyltetrahydrofolate cyclo-ligase [Gammaproteobacteria bacterium]